MAPAFARKPDLVALTGGAKPGAPKGRVLLVGAGPGAADLLTLRAARAIAAADVVVHDRLVSGEVLALAPARARRIYVGKRKSAHSVPQASIDALLVALALEGHVVVRVKGGDPFVFGRGGEELMACRAAGVPCEVIPGISAAFAAAASAGVPLTHRGLAQSVTFATGHAAISADGGIGAPDLDWAALAEANRTVVLYMGVSTAAVLSEKLIAAGRAAATPALVVENASRIDERRLLTTLGELGETCAEVEGPAVLILGEVAAMADVGSDAEALRQVAFA